MIYIALARIWGLILSLCIGPVQSASGELSPDQIAVIANRNSSRSLAVARHYASRRSVPTGHILELDLPQNETVSRGGYEQKLVLPARRLLEVRRLTSTIRAVVTTYGVPLRVQAPHPTNQEQRWRKDASERHRFARAYLEKILEWATKIAAAEENDLSASGKAPSSGEHSEAIPDADQAILERLNAAVGEAAVRVQRAHAHESRERIVVWTNELARLSVQAGGMAALVQSLHASLMADPKKDRAELNQLKQQVTLAQNMIQVLMESPSDTNRKRGYRLAERMFGLQGILRLATAEIESFDYQAGDASVDSELSLLWWDSDMYRIAGRIANPLHYGSASTGKQASPLGTLMVSRLDAPTSDLAMRLVDQAIETEQRGLSGKVYVDAQGLKSGNPLGYGYYDQTLRSLADLFRRQTSYEVIVDNEERRFSQPSEAPDVAVYAGWYKLRSYEDAFTFLPGALGYHIASAEAISIHDPNESGWCKNALERGVTVTLGSTDEPYLDAFPPPNEFFALLLTGRYSLVEAYAMTSRYTSWRMVLFGDPLYNPWRGKGYVNELHGILQSNLVGQSGFPLPPSTLPFKDPLQARQVVKQARETLLAQVDTLLERLERPKQSSP